MVFSLSITFSTISFAQALQTRIGGAFSLFNGQDTSAWNRVGNANWYPINNGVAADQGSGLLVGRFAFTDYQVEFEYWIDDKTQFSLFTHCLDSNYISTRTALEINLSNNVSGEYGPGSIVGLKKAISIPSILNRWNTVFISSLSNQLTIIINGTKVIDSFDSGRFTSGPFAIQFNGGNIKITNFSATIPGRW